MCSTDPAQVQVVTLSSVVSTGVRLERSAPPNPPVTQCCDSLSLEHKCHRMIHLLRLRSQIALVSNITEEDDLLPGGLLCQSLTPDIPYMLR